MRRRNLSQYSYALRYALAMVERMAGDDLVLAPIVPTSTMLEHGVEAGKVSANTAARVYRAMIERCQ